MKGLTKPGLIVGVIGVALFIASWIAVGLGGRFLPPTIVPRLWTIVLFAALPAALILGVVAGWKGSRWWFLLCGMSLLSEVFCMLSLAV